MQKHTSTARLVLEFSEHCGGHFERGTLKPIVYKTFPIAQVEAAHACMANNENTGKIILEL